MSRLLRRSGRLAAIATTTAAISLGGLILSAPSASSTTLSSRSTSPILTLDHFLCYHVVAQGFGPPTNVQLRNWLQPTAFTPTIGQASTHCNPARKRVTINGVVRTYKVLHPLSHLLCWQITYNY